MKPSNFTLEVTLDLSTWWRGARFRIHVKPWLTQGVHENGKSYLVNKKEVKTNVVYKPPGLRFRFEGKNYYYCVRSVYVTWMCEGVDNKMMSWCQGSRVLNFLASLVSLLLFSVLQSFQYFVISSFVHYKIINFARPIAVPLTERSFAFFTYQFITDFVVVPVILVSSVWNKKLPAQFLRRYTPPF